MSTSQSQNLVLKSKSVKPSSVIIDENTYLYISEEEEDSSTTSSQSETRIDGNAMSNIPLKQDPPDPIDQKTSTSTPAAVPVAAAPTRADNQETKQLLNFIEALKFDAAKEATLTKKKEERSDNSIDSLVNKLKFQTEKNKDRHVKPRVTFSNSQKSSRDLLDHNSNSSNAKVKSHQKEHNSKPKNSDLSNSTTSEVIRDWGRRPLLVESEAPWTPRNQKYFKAIKALSKLNPNAAAVASHSLRVPQGYPQPVAAAASPFPNFMIAEAQQRQQQMQMPPPTMTYISNAAAASAPTSPNAYYYQQQENAPTISFPPPKIPVMASNAPQQTPYVAGISPMPAEIIGNRPLAVAIESPYPYQQEFVVPVQPPTPQLPLPQQQIFGHLDSQGLWMPLIQQQRQAEYYEYEQQMRQHQQQQR